MKPYFISALAIALAIQGCDAKTPASTTVQETAPSQTPSVTQTAPTPQKETEENYSDRTKFKGFSIELPKDWREHKMKNENPSIAGGTTFVRLVPALDNEPKPSEWAMFCIESRVINEDFSEGNALMASVIKAKATGGTGAQDVTEGKIGENLFKNVWMASQTPIGIHASQVFGITIDTDDKKVFYTFVVSYFKRPGGGNITDESFIKTMMRAIQSVQLEKPKTAAVSEAPKTAKNDSAPTSASASTEELATPTMRKWETWRKSLKGSDAERINTLEHLQTAFKARNFLRPRCF